MKVFIGVESCHKDRYTHQQIRETWLKDCPVEYKFFLVNPCDPCPNSDELALDSFDGHERLLHKFRREIDYVLDGGYDFFFRCHIDTYVHVPRLLRAVPYGEHYVGFPQTVPDARGFPICYGGAGTWFSRPAMICLQAVLGSPKWESIAEGSLQYWDDWWIGSILHDRNFERIADLRYQDRRPGPAPDNDIITVHETLQGHLKDPHNVRERRYLMEAHEIAQKIPEGK